MSGGGFVYSTQHGKLCPGCGRPLAGCACERMRDEALRAAGDGVVRVARSTKGRKGSGVTVVSGLGLGGADLKALAKELKKKLGTGGAVKDGDLEFQGEQRDKLVALLEARGYRVRRSGG
ncbi:MAG TPA: stress response translation initiation inhibitor YciH [Planctomycetes bacterium]|nr:stress response translation initiation inhibitor YciH [Planctomycetota bacterium]